MQDQSDILNDASIGDIEMSTKVLAAHRGPVH